MAVTVGINGFGVIGRKFVRVVLERYPEIKIAAVNDLTDPATMAHLLKYDSVYGTLAHDVVADRDHITVGDHTIRVYSERDPARVPWSDHGVSVVIESTGLFRGKDTAGLHISGGKAKKVIISAPGKDEDITVVMGVNERDYDPGRHHILSNASCTTNCLAPVAKVLNDEFGLEHGLMSTIHAYTNDQRVLDMHHKDLRRARAAAENIIPTSTGAAVAVGRVLPDIKGKLNGLSYRVPVPAVSVVDLVAVLKKDADDETINQAMRKAAAGELNGILDVTDIPLVSSDIKGMWASAIVDLLSTMVVGKRLARVVAWYDNEWAYCARLADLTMYLARRGL